MLLKENLETLLTTGSQSGCGGISNVSPFPFYLALTEHRPSSQGLYAT